jgi:hypothetical protein
MTAYTLVLLPLTTYLCQAKQSVLSGAGEIEAATADCLQLLRRGTDAGRDAIAMQMAKVAAALARLRDARLSVRVITYDASQFFLIPL